MQERQLFIILTQRGKVTEKFITNYEKNGRCNGKRRGVFCDFPAVKRLLMTPFGAEESARAARNA